MVVLPELMVAPNGARRSRMDHPELPVTIPQLVSCAAACYAAGADGIHAHVRDAEGRHVLDAGLYRELLQEMQQQVPGMTVQVTSEAAGRYQAHEQQAVIRALRPAYVSVALREMIPAGCAAEVRRQAEAFYRWARDEQVTIQHILYSAEDVRAWFRAVESGWIPLPADTAQLLLVLGRYRENLDSQPADLQPFLDVLHQYQHDRGIDWAVCAFGVGETACLLEAIRQGGKVRVGFENSLWHADGSLAANNQERVAALRAYLG